MDCPDIIQKQLLLDCYYINLALKSTMSVKYGNVHVVIILYGSSFK